MAVLLRSSNTIWSASTSTAVPLGGVLKPVRLSPWKSDLPLAADWAMAGEAAGRAPAKTEAMAQTSATAHTRAIPRGHACARARTRA
jgi:hypothetical protein